MTRRNPTVLVLNSARSKYPLGSDQWIQETVRAIDSLSAGQVTMLTSVEPVMWDLVTYLAGRSGMNLKFLVPWHDCEKSRRRYSELLTSFGIGENRATPMFLDDGTTAAGKEVWRERDWAALQKADVICPVSIRPGGRLESLLAGGGYHADFWQEFRIPWEEQDPAGRIPRYDFSGRRPKPFPPGDWLIHWTRASQGPWPDEPKRAFFSDMLAEPDRFVRSAPDTLARLLSENRLRASSWNLPVGSSAIAFTALDPHGAFPLMRWRKRFVRYNFEPYGIAVSRDTAIACGAKEVAYVDDPESENSDRLFVHAKGEKVDWSDEQEWRLPGDLDLNDLPEKSYFAIVPDQGDAERLRERLGGDEVGIHVLFR